MFGEKDKTVVRRSESKSDESNGNLGGEKHAHYSHTLNCAVCVQRQCNRFEMVFGVQFG